jgi:cap1 methyltransferase
MESEDEHVKRFQKRQRTHALGYDCEEAVSVAVEGSAAAAASFDVVGRTNPADVRSSWFPSVDVLPSLRTNHHPCNHADGDDSDADSSRRIELEIITLSKQLSSLKRRLGPASEEVARAVTDCQLPRDFHRRRRQRHPATNPSLEFVQARRLCNPYEALGEGRNGGLNSMFINRSAIKLANIDALLQFQLAQSANAGDEFCFVDLCGAPGGFSEYLLHRCFSNQQPVRAYGMSLSGFNDEGSGLLWRLPDTSHCVGGSHVFQFRIVHGSDGTGDICNWENVKYLRSTMAADSCPADSAAAQTTSDHVGWAHLVLCDGGVDAQRDSDYQEEVTQKLVVCQASAALDLLKPGGTVVLKMFGFRTPVIRMMVQDMACFFDKVTALKPISSRPASAERYVVFSGYQKHPSWIGGLQWQSRIFRADSSQSLLDLEAAKRLGHYLDHFDRDMLKLNLESCFAILSHLERKLLSCSRTTDAHFDSMDEEGESERINVAAYRTAWCLNI